jgi:hypothetical protein
MGAVVVFLLFVIAAVLFAVDAVRTRGLTSIGLCLVAVAFAVGAAPGAGIG